MPRKNKRDKRRDPREAQFLSGASPESIQKPARRKGKWNATAERSDPELRIEDDDGERE